MTIHRNDGPVPQPNNIQPQSANTDIRSGALARSEEIEIIGVRTPPRPLLSIDMRTPNQSMLDITTPGIAAPHLNAFEVSSQRTRLPVDDDYGHLQPLPKHSSMLFAASNQQQLISVRDVAQALRLLPDSPKLSHIEALNPTELNEITLKAFRSIKHLLLIKDKLLYRQDLLAMPANLPELLALVEREYEAAKPSIGKRHSRWESATIDMKSWLNSLAIESINQIFLRSGPKHQYVSQLAYAKKIHAIFEEFKQDIRNGYQQGFQLLVEDDCVALAHRVLQDSHFPAGQASRVNILSSRNIKAIISEYTEQGLLTKAMEKDCLDMIAVTKRLASPWTRSDIFREILLITQMKTNEVQEPILVTPLYRDVGLQTVTSVESTLDFKENRRRLHNNTTPNLAYRVPVGSNFYGENSLMSLSVGQYDKAINPLHHVASLLKKNISMYWQFEKTSIRQPLMTKGSQLLVSAIEQYNTNDIALLKKTLSNIEKFIKKNNIQLLNSDQHSQEKLDAFSEYSRKLISDFAKVINTAELYPTYVEGQKYLVALPMIKSHMAELEDKKIFGQALSQAQQLMLDNFNLFQSVLLAKYGVAYTDVTDALVIEPLEMSFYLDKVSSLNDFGIFNQKPDLSNSGLWHFQPSKIPINDEELARELESPIWQAEMDNSSYSEEAVRSFAKNQLHLRKKIQWLYRLNKQDIDKIVAPFNQLIRDVNKLNNPADLSLEKTDEILPSPLKTQLIQLSESTIFKQEASPQERIPLRLRLKPRESVPLKLRLHPPEVDSNRQFTEPHHQALTWVNKLKSELNGTLPPQHIFTVREKRLRLTRSTIAFILKKADENQGGSNTKIGKAVKAIDAQSPQPEDWAEVVRQSRKTFKKAEVVAALIRDFAPRITNPSLQANQNTTKQPLPSAGFFSGSWEAKLAVESLPESERFLVNGRHITLTEASIACLLKTADSVSFKRSNKGNYLSDNKLSEAVKKLNSYYVPGWNMFGSFKNKESVVRAVIGKFAPRITNPELRSQKYTEKKKLPDAIFFAPLLINKLKKTLPDKQTFTINNKEITLTKAFLALLISTADAAPAKTTGVKKDASNDKMNAALKELNKYDEKGWQKINEYVDRWRIVRLVLNEYAPQITNPTSKLTYATIRLPLPPLESLLGKWQSKLIIDLDDAPTLHIDGETVTLSEHTLAFMCSTADKLHKDIKYSKSLTGKSQQFIRDTVKTMNRHKTEDWSALPHKPDNPHYKDNVVYAFLRHISPRIAEPNLLPPPPLSKLRGAWEEHLKQNPLPAAINYHYQGQNIFLSKKTLYFLLKKVHRAAANASPGDNKQSHYTYAAQHLRKVDFRDWSAIKNVSKQKLIENLVIHFAPGIRDI